MPPKLFAKAGINVPGTPFAVIWRRPSSPATARYTGFASEIAAPFRPFSPWQAVQLALYKVEKSSASSGLTTSGPGPGRPGMRVHPADARPATISARALSTVNCSRASLMESRLSRLLQRHESQHEQKMAALETAASAPSPGESRRIRQLVRTQSATRQTTTNRFADSESG